MDENRECSNPECVLTRAHSGPCTPIAPEPKRTTTTCSCDHHGRAEEALVDAIELDGYHEGHELLRANVEATLALVDEQRTANLIAFLNTNTPPAKSASNATAAQRTREDRRRAAHAEIVERLGLSA